MLQIPHGPFLTPSSKVFEEGIACTVGKNHKRLDELARGDLGFPLVHNIAGWFHIPGPTKVRPATQPPSERQEAVPEENPTLDEVRKPIENLNAPLQGTLAYSRYPGANTYHDATIRHAARRNSNKTEEQNDSIDYNVNDVQSPENSAGNHARDTLHKETFNNCVLPPGRSAARAKILILWLAEFIVLHWRPTVGRLKPAVERSRVPLCSLAAVSRPAVGMEGAIGFGVVVIHIIGRHGKEGGSLMRS
jgi:hypothetical protein